MGFEKTIENFLSIPDDYLSRTPKVPNYLQEPAFKINIARIPNVAFYCSSVKIPGCSVQHLEFPSNRGQVSVPVSGSFEREELSMDFYIDEEFISWLQLYRWLSETTTISDTEDYEEIQNHYSDMNVVFLNSAMNPTLKITYKDILPKSLTGFNFSSTVTDVAPIIASATFEYTSFSIERIE